MKSLIALRRMENILKRSLNFAHLKFCFNNLSHLETFKFPNFSEVKTQARYFTFPTAN